MIIPFSKKLKETCLLNRAVPICIIAIAASIISYCFIDIPLAIYCKGITPGWASVAQFGTDLIDPRPEYIIWATLYFFCFFFWRKKALANKFLLLAISVPLANAIVEVLKRLFGRARPELLFSQNLFGFDFFAAHNPEFSFPSGHACTAGVVMGALACFYPKHSYLLLIIAFLLAFTRVLLNYHYLSDILIGTMIGLLTSQWVYRTMKIEK